MMLSTNDAIANDRLIHVDLFDISGVEAVCAAQLANAIAEAEA